MWGVVRLPWKRGRCRAPSAASARRPPGGPARPCRGGGAASTPVQEDGGRPRSRSGGGDGTAGGARLAASCKRRLGFAAAGGGGFRGRAGGASGNNWRPKLGPSPVSGTCQKPSGFLCRETFCQQVLVGQQRTLEVRPVVGDGSCGLGTGGRVGCLGLRKEGMGSSPWSPWKCRSAEGERARFGIKRRFWGSRVNRKGGRGLLWGRQRRRWRNLGQAQVKTRLCLGRRKRSCSLCGEFNWVGWSERRLVVAECPDDH